MTALTLPFSRLLRLVGCAGFCLILGWGQVACGNSEGDGAGPLGAEQSSSDTLEDANDPGLEAPPDVLDRGPEDALTSGDGSVGRAQPDGVSGTPNTTTDPTRLEDVAENLHGDAFGGGGEVVDEAPGDPAPEPEPEEPDPEPEPEEPDPEPEPEPAEPGAAIVHAISVYEGCEDNGPPWCIGDFGCPEPMFCLLNKCAASASCLTNDDCDAGYQCECLAGEEGPCQEQGCLPTDLPGEVSVVLEETTGPLTLSLSAYSPVNWTVLNPNGVDVERVILSGYHLQTIAGLDSAIPLEIHTYEGGSPDWYTFSESNVPSAEDGYPPAYIQNWKDDYTEEVAEFLTAVEGLAGQAPDGWQSHYKGSHFMVHEGGSLLETESIQAIGVYEGAPSDYEVCGDDLGAVQVTVEPTDGPVTLLLMAYSPVRWNLDIKVGATISGVVLGGYNGQHLTGVPPGAVVRHRGFYGFEGDTDQFLWAADRMEELTGATVDGFQYAYQGETFTVP